MGQQGLEAGGRNGRRRGDRRRRRRERPRRLPGQPVGKEGHGRGPVEQGPLRHPDLLHLGLLQPLRLGAPVLEPDLDLHLGEAEVVGELCPLGDAQVLLLPELLLQRVQLLRGEWGPGLAIRFVLPQGAAQGAGWWLKPEV